MQKQEFIIRSYAFVELAQLYSPNITPKNAAEKLHLWIRLNKKLVEELNAQGFYPGLRSLSPKMVELIVGAIGEP